MSTSGISRSTLQRLPTYLTYLKTLPEGGSPYISATNIAAALGLGEVQVRKDLAAVTSGGKPKVGYVITDLIRELDQFLGYTDLSDAIIVGCGKLGRALLDYQGFSQYGLKLLAGFDNDPKAVGITEHGQKIFPMDKLGSFCSRNRVSLAIIAVPAAHAQEVCDLLVESGIRGILNMSAVHLTVPKGIAVSNENIAVSLAALAAQVENHRRP